MSRAIYIISGRNIIIGKDVKVCYLECDQRTEFTNKETCKVLNKYEAELRTVCPATSQHNSVAERFNQTIQKTIRSYLFDSKLPSYMWNLALAAATYIYNLTPHKAIDLDAPLKKFAPKSSIDINQLKRFGCIAYAQTAKGPNSKFDKQSIKTALVGYTKTGYLLLDSIENKIHETRNVRFIESKVYGDEFIKK